MTRTTIHSDYIPDNAITGVKIAENSITAREIATNAITTLYVADDSVTADKLANSINTDIATGVAALPKAGGTMTGNIAHASDLTLDVGGNIVLDADGGGVYFKDAGTNIGFFQNDGGDFRMISAVNDKDIKFIGTDGGSLVTALTLDMSNAGRANFNNDIGLSDNRGLRLGSGDDSVIYNLSLIHI